MEGEFASGAAGAGTARGRQGNWLAEIDAGHHRRRRLAAHAGACPVFRPGQRLGPAALLNGTRERQFFRVSLRRRGWAGQEWLPGCGTGHGAGRTPWRRPETAANREDPMEGRRQARVPSLGAPTGTRLPAMGGTFPRRAKARPVRNTPWRAGPRCGAGVGGRPTLRTQAGTPDGRRRGRQAEGRAVTGREHGPPQQRRCGPRPQGQARRYGTSRSAARRGV